MALSVSAFPEHIQARHNELLSSGDDGSNRGVANTPRILGFFGGVSSGAGSKKPESQSSPRLAARVDESDGYNSPGTTVSTTLNSPALQFSPPQRYEESIESEEQNGLLWAPNTSKRHHPAHHVRRTTPSPIRLGSPSGPNRLEIGAEMRTSPFPTHIPSKSTSALAQHWGSSEASPSSLGQPLSSSRPLPIVPNPASEPFKAGPASLPSSPGLLKPAGSILLPSRSASAITRPPRQPGSATRTTASPITPPSKVLITQPQRSHKPNSTSVSMRYQPFFVDPDAPPTSSSPKQNSDPSIFAPSAVRPSPRVPPSLSSVVNFGLPSSGISANSSNSASIAQLPLKRPRTSPGSFSGFSGSNGSRSAVPSSWVSKPSSSRPSSPPSSPGPRATGPTHPRRPPALKMPRARSWSRTRRERSLDSYSRLSSRTPPNSAGMTTSFSLSAGNNRSLTVGRYGSFAGGRSNVTSTIMGRQQERREPFLAMSRSGEGMEGKGSNHQMASSSWTRNSTLRHVRPQSPPSGPVMRKKSVSGHFPFNTLSSPKSTPQGLSTPDDHSIPSTVQTPAVMNIANAETSSMESLHVHPIITSLGDDESRRTSMIESPIEFFVDGPETDVASTNRSPSPIRYALPSSNGDSSDWNSTDEETTDDDLGGVSSSTSNSRGWAVGRRRTQLRSYKMEYGPQTRLDAYDFDRKRTGSPSPYAFEAAIQNLPQMPRILPVPPKPSSRERKKGKEGNKKKEKWSFGDFTSMGSISSPGTRASSPERKGRSRQPRRLAEAVSLALGSSNPHITASHSRSGLEPSLISGLTTSLSHTNDVRRGGGVVPTEYEVLDIRMPLDEGKDGPRDNRSSPLDFRIHGSSSTLRANPQRPERPMSTKRRVITREDSSGSYTSESGQSDLLWVTKEGKQSGLRDRTRVESRIIFRNPLEDDSESDDIPFMWLSRDKPPEKPSAFTPLPLEQSRHGDSQEVIPRSVSPIVAVEQAQQSASVDYPMKRARKNDEVGRTQRTTSGPSRFNISGSSSGATDANAQFMNVLRVGPKEESKQVDQHSEVMVMKTRRVMDRGRLWEDSREAQVADVIPKLRTLKTTR